MFTDRTLAGEWQLAAALLCPHPAGAGSPVAEIWSQVGFKAGLPLVRGWWFDSRLLGVLSHVTGNRM